MRLEEKMGQILSDLEWKVLMAYLDGKSYQEIAVELDRHVKSIDNALQRVKRKLERSSDNRGEDGDAISRTLPTRELGVEFLGPDFRDKT